MKTVSEKYDKEGEKETESYVTRLSSIYNILQSHAISCIL